MPLHNDKEVVARAFYNLFNCDNGKFVLDHLCRQWGISHTLEPEEVRNKEIEDRNLNGPGFVMVDPILFAKRQGMRSAYWHIQLWIGQGREIMERTSKDAG